MFCDGRNSETIKKLAFFCKFMPDFSASFSFRALYIRGDVAVAVMLASITATAGNKLI